MILEGDRCRQPTRASPILKRLHWLPIESRCIFKTATLVYKFLHSGHPSYFGPLLSTRCGRYSTRYNHPDKRFLEVPQFCPSVHGVALEYLESALQRLSAIKVQNRIE